jgi:AcrR family transcriptional regulator
MKNQTDLRKEVLKASLALIEEGGLDRLSMREAARKAGVSHQAPYHHFADRESILATIAGEGFSKLGKSLERAAAQAGPEPGKAVGAEVRRSMAVACWAMVHGLATLILEGSLARKVRIPKSRQKCWLRR